MSRSAILTLAAVAAAICAALPEPAHAQAKGAAVASGVVKLRIVNERYVVVDQHPLVVPKEDTRGRITWELPPAPSKWRFAADSVAIDGGQFLGCHVEAAGLKYVCTDKSPRQRQLWQYRVTVYDGAGNDAKSIFTDSAVQND